jgi:hypothetical protein
VEHLALTSEAGASGFTTRSPEARRTWENRRYGQPNVYLRRQGWIVGRSRVFRLCCRRTRFVAPSQADAPAQLSPDSPPAQGNGSKRAPGDRLYARFVGRRPDAAALHGNRHALTSLRRAGGKDRISGNDLGWVLAKMGRRRGPPSRRFNVPNRPEPTSNVLHAWAYWGPVESDCSGPRSTADNTFTDAFNASVR